MVHRKDQPERGDRPENDPKESMASQPESTCQPTPEETIGRLEEELRRKTEEAAANLDRCLRAVADAENFKKRVLKEKAEAIRFGNESLLRDVLQVIDNLELALEHAGLGGNGKSVEQGVELTLRLFRDVLQRHGVTEIGDPTGSTFDPATQEATEVETTQAVPPNTVLKTRTKGYRYHDRLLRPVRVVVAGGAPTDAEPGEGEKEPLH